MDDYRIVILSRKRSFNMPVVRHLLPTATVTVEESEMEAYAPFVPSHLLVPHPKLPGPGMTPLRNWVLDNFPEPCIVQSDDDFQFVKVLGGACRILKHPADVQRLIENAIQICCDLDIGVFNWSPLVMAGRTYSARDPICFTRDCWGVFGMRGRARAERRFDVKAIALQDIDWSLQAVRDDRILLTDMRYHFDVGENRTKPGGNMHSDAEKWRTMAVDYLRTKWGPMIPLLPKGQRQPVRPTIPRRQP